MVQIHRGLPSVRGQVNSKIGEALGMSLGQGLGEFTGQYNANKALESVLNDEELKKKPLSERWGALQTKLAPHGKFGQAALQQRLQIEQQAEQEKVQAALAKYREGKTLTEEEKASLPTKVQFDIEENERKKDEFEKKQSDAEQKEKTRIQDIRNVGKARGISDQDIFEHINQGGSVEGAKAAWEKPKSVKSGYGKNLEERVNQTIKQGTEFAPVMGQIASMEELIPKLKGVSTFKAWQPGSKEWEASSEFEAKSDTILGPLFKLYNPAGALPNAKVEMLRKRLKPNWYDTEGTQRAKLDAIKFLGDAKVKQAKLFQEALYKYDNDPPDKVMLEIERISDDALDAFDDKVLENIEKEDGKFEVNQKNKASPARADGKIKVKDKSTGKEGFIIPTEGWEERFERV